MNENLTNTMKLQRSFRKFSPQKTKIEELEKNSPRFKRIYSEYESISNDLWDLENKECSPVPDDFIDAVKLQAEYLEEEIDGWLLDTPDIR